MGKAVDAKTGGRAFKLKLYTKGAELGMVVGMLMVPEKKKVGLRFAIGSSAAGGRSVFHKSKNDTRT